MTNTQVLQKPAKYISGLNILHISLSQLTIAAGEVRDSSNIADLKLLESVVINSDKVGVNGRDQVTPVLNVFYHIFVIGDTTLTNPTATIISANSTPLLPVGYDVFRDIGWARVDGAGLFLDMVQTGGSNTRRYTYSSKRQILTAGSSLTFADLDTSSWVPDLGQFELGMVNLNVEFTVGGPGSRAYFRTFGETTSLASSLIFSASVAGIPAYTQISLPNRAPTGLEYAVDNINDDLSVWILGFEYHI